MSEQLLPCPFCGGAAQVVGDRDVGFCVVSDCGAALGEEYDNAAYHNHDFITEADAIEAWNRRRATSTPAAAPDALREALSWALDMIDMYDERLAGIDGRERVYSTVHLAGKAKARAALATAPAAEPPREPDEFVSEYHRLAWEAQQASQDAGNSGGSELLQKVEESAWAALDAHVERFAAGPSGAAAPTPEALRALAERFDNPIETPPIVVRTDARFRPDYTP